MSQDLNQTIQAFNDAFSSQDLERVMSFFASNSEFREMNGHVAKGKPAVRKAIARVFSGEYGRLVFLEKSVVIDEEKREAFFSWYCQHDLSEKKVKGIRGQLTYYLMKLAYGKHMYWEGADYFKFDENHNIVSKQSFGKAAMPKMIRGKR